MLPFNSENFLVSWKVSTDEHRRQQCTHSDTNNTSAMHTSKYYTWFLSSDIYIYIYIYMHTSRYYSGFLTSFSKVFFQLTPIVSNQIFTQISNCRQPFAHAWRPLSGFVKEIFKCGFAPKYFVLIFMIWFFSLVILDIFLVYLTVCSRKYGETGPAVWQTCSHIQRSKQFDFFAHVVSQTSVTNLSSIQKKIIVEAIHTCVWC